MMQGAAWKFLLPGIYVALLVTLSAHAVDVTLDARITGRVFQGLGTVSAGASSRLLMRPSSASSRSRVGSLARNLSLIHI